DVEHVPGHVPSPARDPVVPTMMASEIATLEHYLPWGRRWGRYRGEGTVRRCAGPRERGHKSGPPGSKPHALEGERTNAPARTHQHRRPLACRAPRTSHTLDAP